MLNQEAVQRMVSQCRDLWITPELARRGLPPEAFDKLTQILIVLTPGTGTHVLLEEQFEAVAKAKVTNDKQRKVGDPLYEDEIDGIEDLYPGGDFDHNNAFILMVRLGHRWIIAFDARYSLLRANDQLAAADEFLVAARFCHVHRVVRPFIDLLFSAGELIAKAELLLMADPVVTKKETHKGILYRMSKTPRIDPVLSEFRKAFNKLSGLRNDARYLKGDLRTSGSECEHLLETVEDMRAQMAQLARPRALPPKEGRQP